MVIDVSGFCNIHQMGERATHPIARFFRALGVVAPPCMRRPCRVVAPCQAPEKTHTRMRSTAVSRIIAPCMAKKMTIVLKQSSAGTEKGQGGTGLSPLL